MKTNTSNLSKQVKSQFDEIYDFHWEKLFQYVYRMTMDYDLSQIIVQDIFISLWQKNDLTEIENVEAYLFKAAKFQVFKNYRDSKFNREILENKFDDFVEENIADIDEEIVQEINKQVELLPEKQREIFILNKIEGLTNTEISEELNLCNQTIRNQLSSALKQLKFNLSKSGLLILLYILFH